MYFTILLFTFFGCFEFSRFRDELLGSFYDAYFLSYGVRSAGECAVAVLAVPYAEALAFDFDFGAVWAFMQSSLFFFYLVELALGGSTVSCAETLYRTCTPYFFCHVREKAGGGLKRFLIEGV